MADESDGKSRIQGIGLLVELSNVGVKTTAVAQKVLKTQSSHWLNKVELT